MSHWVRYVQMETTPVRSHSSDTLALRERRCKQKYDTFNAPHYSLSVRILFRRNIVHTHKRPQLDALLNNLFQPHLLLLFVSTSSSTVSTRPVLAGPRNHSLFLLSSSCVCLSLTHIPLTNNVDACLTIIIII